MSQTSRSLTAKVLGLGLLAVPALADTCNYVGRGFNLYNQDSANILASCTIFEGTIVVEPQVTGTIVLNGVQKITEGIRFQSTGTTLGGFSAPMLTTIAEDFTSTIPNVKSIDLPALASVSNLILNGSTNLAGFSAPSLTTVSGNVLLQNPSADYWSFALPTLKSVGGNLTVIKAPNLGQIWMPDLTTITEDFVMEHNSDALYNNINVDSLTSVNELIIEDGTGVTVDNCGYWLDWVCLKADAEVVCNNKTAETSTC